MHHVKMGKCDSHRELAENRLQKQFSSTPGALIWVTVAATCDVILVAAVAPQVIFPYVLGTLLMSEVIFLAVPERMVSPA